MSEYMFGVSREKPTRRAAKEIERIANRHGADFIEAVIPGTGYQRWFSAENRGEPFDRQVSNAVYRDLIAARLMADPSGSKPKA
jgi:hypothetical protein